MDDGYGEVQQSHSSGRGARLAGITAIAIYFFAKATVLAFVAVIGFSGATPLPGTDELVSQLAPTIVQIGAVGLAVKLAPVFAVLDLAWGLGFWYVQGWARLLLFWDLAYRLGRFALAVGLLSAVSHKQLGELFSSPFTPIGLLLSVVMVWYLSNSDVKRAFGVTSTS